MFKVTFLIAMNSSMVGFKWFKSKQEALDYAATVPLIEIKYYENSNNN
jgi:hypothetical protein